MYLLHQLMPLIYLISTVIIFIACPMIGSATARKKGRIPFVWGLLCFFCPPMLIVLLLLDYGSYAPLGHRKCPHCAEWIKDEAKACRYCTRDVTPITTITTKPCPHCNADIDASLKTCPSCGKTMFC